MLCTCNHAPNPTMPCHAIACMQHATCMKLKCLLMNCNRQTQIKKSIFKMNSLRLSKIQSRIVVRGWTFDSLSVTEQFTGTITLQELLIPQVQTRPTLPNLLLLHTSKEQFYNVSGRICFFSLFSVYKPRLQFLSNGTVLHGKCSSKYANLKGNRLISGESPNSYVSCFYRPYVNFWWLLLQRALFNLLSSMHPLCNCYNSIS